MQDTWQKISKMQDAFDTISEKTYKYFDTSEIKKEELVLYKYLAEITIYFIKNKTEIGKVINPKITIKQWFKDVETKRLITIKQVLSEIKKYKDWSFIYPIKTTEDGPLRRVIIGVYGLKWEDLGSDNNFTILVAALSDLIILDIDQYIIVTLKNNFAEKPLGISIYKDFLIKFKNSVEKSAELNENDFGNPLPIQIDNNMLEPLGNITVPIIEPSLRYNLVSDIIFQLWKIYQTRLRLSKDSSIEFAWLQELENNFKQKIFNLLEALEKENSILAEKYKKIAFDVCNEIINFSDEYIQNLLLSDVYN
jgi:hypothetical protein